MQVVAAGVLAVGDGVGRARVLVKERVVVVRPHKSPPLRREQRLPGVRALQHRPPLQHGASHRRIDRRAVVGAGVAGVDDQQVARLELVERGRPRGTDKGFGVLALGDLVRPEAQPALGRGVGQVGQPLAAAPVQHQADHLSRRPGDRLLGPDHGVPAPLQGRDVRGVLDDRQLGRE